MAESNGRRSVSEESADSRSRYIAVHHTTHGNQYYLYHTPILFSPLLPTSSRPIPRYKLAFIYPSTPQMPPLHFPQSSPSSPPNIMATLTFSDLVDTRPHPYSIARSYSVYDTHGSDTHPSDSLSATAAAPAATVPPPTPSRSTPLAVRVTSVDRARLRK